MMRIVMIAVAVLTAAPAFAEDAKVTITKKDCQRMLRHSPSGDVAYQPGVDVKGRKVAPADLPGSGADIKVLPDVLQIPIAIDAVNRMGSVGVSSAESTVGTVAYDIAKGTFTYNGQPIGSSDQAALAESCRKMGVR